MKRALILAFAAAMMAACTGILDTAPRNQISDGNMWTTASLSKAGIDGLTYPLKREVSGLSDLIPADGKGGLNRIGIEGTGYTSILDGPCNFLRDASKKASGRENSAEWKSMYMVIHSCNKAIAHLDKNVVGQPLYEQYICEARMIRAFCYTRLVCLFGEVPIYLDETDNKDCTKTQDSWDDVWKMIIDECTICIDNAAFQLNNLSGDRAYRPSKGMAYALRGNAYMWLAANKNPEIYEGATGITAAEVKEYHKLAAADFKSVKDCEFGLWTGNWEDLFLPANEHNPEMIFPLEYSATPGFSSVWQWVIGTRSQLDACWDRLVPSAEFVDDFEWADGSKFSWVQVFPDWNKLLPRQREVFFLRDSLETFATNGSDAEKAVTLRAQREKVISRISQEVYDKYYLDLGNEARLRTAYDNRDPRLDKAVVTPYKQYRMCNEFSISPINFQLRWPRYKRQDDVDDSDLWVELSANMVYAWNKSLITDGSLLDRTLDGTDWPLIRYTQVQLMWAEALLGSGEIEGAKALLNEIRHDRAGMPKVTSSDPDTVLEEIRYETRVELCQEGQDFFNEIRWGTFKEKKFSGKTFTDPQTCWREGGWKTGYYYVDGMWPWSAPLDEIVMNSNLKKRPAGWTY